MKELRKIGVLSFAKIYGLLMAIMGVFVGAIYAMMGMFMGLAGAAAGEGALFGLIFGGAALIIMPIFYGVLGFVGGIISAWIYNVLAGWIGGVELDLADKKK